MELEILNYIQSLRSPLMDMVMLFFTKLGEHGIIWIVLGLALMCTKKYKRLGITILISLVLCLIFGNIILKNFIKRVRPSWVNKDIILLIKNPKDYSFPSGHTFASFAAAMSIYIGHKKKSIAAFVLASLIAFSRLYLYVHYPSDILGGIAFGILMALVANIIYEKILIKKKDN